MPTTDLGFLRLQADAFAKAPQKSIDYAVMEKTDRAAVVAGNFRWSDIGSWDALFDITPRNADGNVVHGPVVTVDATGTASMHSDGRLTAVDGVNDLVVVTTSDAVMVIPRSRAQEVRELVAKLKAGQARRGDRPQARAPALGLLRVNRPGRAFPGQAHRRHSRRRVVAAEASPPRRALGGGARDRRSHHRRHDSGACTKTSRFTFRSAPCTGSPTSGKIPLELIEVQTGSYLGEDDIERIEDIYKRK